MPISPAKKSCSKRLSSRIAAEGQGEALFILDERDQDMTRVLRKLGVSYLEMLIEPNTLALFGRHGGIGKIS